MRKMNMGVGVLILLGFMLIMSGAIFKLSGVNLLEPQIRNVQNFFVLANSCFLIALIVDRFDRPDQD